MLIIQKITRNSNIVPQTQTQTVCQNNNNNIPGQAFGRFLSDLLGPYYNNIQR